MFSREAVDLHVLCRLTNVFVIGKADRPLISLPKGKGVRLTILQEQTKIYKTEKA